MRLRKKPKALETLKQNQNLIIFKPEEKKGNWKEYFGNDRPLYVELGTGKGKFIVENAHRYPNKNFIGIDSKFEVIYMALKRALDRKIDNLALLPFNIESIEEIFDKNEVDCLFINFCDPWPKSKHAKRRLINVRFLEKYKLFLKDDAQIIFKTDNRPLFDYSIEEFKAANLDITDITYDLASENDPENVPTEYETKFMERGVKINRLKAVYRTQDSELRTQD
ncbi:MAG: tRNA (guanosine(46)-N7)-methyltransferase TrmB [Lutispora sp.]|nr:tRNA (guanosine(46)-N7)-methyltransferase TrmB [Lutispora sp.]